MKIYQYCQNNADIKYGLDCLGRKLTRSVNAPHISLHNVSPNSLGGPVGPIPVRLTTYYHDNYIYESNGTRILIPGGYIMKQGSSYSYHYYVNDYQGNVRAVIDENGNLEEANDYYPYGMLMTDDSGNIANVQPYKFSAKEYETCYGLNIYDFGARRLNPASLIFTTPDPMCEKYYSISPYIYCAGNPVIFSDPTGESPIYSPDGKFLGTDDDGIVGDYYVLKEEDFNQCMSHEDVLKFAINTTCLDEKILNLISSHFNTLPSRPDYDGYLTLDEANEWYRNGNGQSLYVDLSKIDLSGIRSLGEKYVGEVKSFNLQTNSNNINDGLVYGNITLKRYPNNTVRAFADRYDFDMKSWFNPLVDDNFFQRKNGVKYLLKY